MFASPILVKNKISLPDILYNMDSFKTVAGLRYIENIGKLGNTHDASMFASSHVALNENGDTDQSAPLNIHHQLGADTKQTATLGTGWADNGSDSYTATDATSSLSDVSSSATNTVQIEFTISNWTSGSVEGFDGNGTYIVNVDDTSLESIAFSGDVLINSVKEISIDNSYLTYFDVASRGFIKVTTVNEDVDFFNEGGIDEPNTAIWDDNVCTVNFLNPTTSITSPAFYGYFVNKTGILYHVKIKFNVFSGEVFFNKFVSGDETGTIINNGYNELMQVGEHIFELDTYQRDGNRSYALLNGRDYSPSEYSYTIEYTALQSISGNPTTHTMTTSFSNAFSTDAEVTDDDIILLNAEPELIAKLMADDLTTGLSFSKSNVKHWYKGNDYENGASVEDSVSLTSATIENYTDACRDTLHNTNYGLSSLMTSPGTIVGDNDGRYLTLPLSSPTDYLVDVDVKKIEGNESSVLVTLFDDSTEQITP